VAVEFVYREVNRLFVQDCVLKIDKATVHYG